ncbi:hypothetical protein ACFWPP_11230 [Streptomyces anulatus]|uniref:hypothetical protein n=1 Tax=Streptomyces anulatus TaxID=1892 RepID=UPI0036631749
MPEQASADDRSAGCPVRRRSRWRSRLLPVRADSGQAGQRAETSPPASAGWPDAVIKEWCAKERHRKVVVTVGDDSIKITGRPDAAQERMVREFQDRVAGDDGPASDDDATCPASTSAELS